jgi:hypothetical protein
MHALNALNVMSHGHHVTMQVGDTLSARVIMSKCSGRRATFATQCVHALTGQVLVDGVALAILPSKEQQERQ